MERLDRVMRKAQLEATTGPSQSAQSQPTSNRGRMSRLDEDQALRTPVEPSHDQPTASTPKWLDSPPRYQAQDPAGRLWDIADEEKNEEALEESTEFTTPDAGDIPLFHPGSQEIALVDLRTGPKSAKKYYINLEQFGTYKQGDKIQRGLYSILREVDETSTMFEVTGRIRWSVNQPGRLREEQIVQKVPPNYTTPIFSATW